MRQCTPNTDTPRAFTLIELLIVVAIIAILAAIAVPNFLEAQVRSKVSRVKSDMRTVATGLESYKVDVNRYPPDFSDYYIDQVTRKEHLRSFLGRLKYLTSPVAYLAALPEDSFAIPLAEGSLQGSAAYRERGVAGGPLIRPFAFDYAHFDRTMSGSTAGLDNPSNWARFTSNVGAVEWGLSSPGPDVTTYNFLGSEGYRVYDPSNGSISAGQIVRTNISAEDVGTNNG
jgi:prepilin-type N-terminal cleavage/methylation domain-containing protein